MKREGNAVRSAEIYPEREGTKGWERVETPRSDEVRVRKSEEKK